MGAFVYAPYEPEMVSYVLKYGFVDSGPWCHIGFEHCLYFERPSTLGKPNVRVFVGANSSEMNSLYLISLRLFGETKISVAGEAVYQSTIYFDTTNYMVRCRDKNSAMMIKLAYDNPG